MKCLLKCGRQRRQQLAIEKIEDIGKYKYGDGDPAPGKNGQYSSAGAVAGAARLLLRAGFQDSRAVKLLH